MEREGKKVLPLEDEIKNNIPNSQILTKEIPFFDFLGEGFELMPMSKQEKLSVLNYFSNLTLSDYFSKISVVQATIPKDKIADYNYNHLAISIHPKDLVRRFQHYIWDKAAPYVFEKDYEKKLEAWKKTSSLYNFSFLPRS